MAQGIDRGPLVSRLLIGFGVLFLIASVAFAGRGLLENWLVEQDYYLTAGEVVPFPLATISWMAPATMTATPRPTVISTSGPPVATARPDPEPTPEPVPDPAKIQIPSLAIDQYIIPLAQQGAQGTGPPTWNTKELIRAGRKERIGHSQGSANPGEEGNMILVGNGHGGVFGRLKRLKPGRKVHVINDAGEMSTYRVEVIKKARLRRKNSENLALHMSFLAAKDTEGLTLVGCNSTSADPCAVRIYVVALPVE
jgi:hypothetical protein